jgi:hypothetical protein
MAKQPSDAEREWAMKRLWSEKTYDRRAMLIVLKDGRNFIFTLKHDAGGLRSIYDAGGGIVTFGLERADLAELVQVLKRELEEC